MPSARVPALLALAGALLLAPPAPAATPPVPSDFLGHEVGADRKLVDHATMVAYLRALDDASDRLRLRELGKSTLGRPFLVAEVADADGLAQMAANRERLGELLDAAATGEERARQIAREGRPVIAFSMGLHSTEVGASQAAMQILYDLVTREDELARRVRRELIVLMVPSMNPDGMDIVNGWYGETVGTPAEGSRPPRLYHHYAGHDNNRDGFFNNLAETALWSRLLYHEALPQVVIDEHQMGSSGPRLFLPPFDDPMSPSVHPLVYSQLSAAGQQAVSDLTALGWTGIATSTSFTGEWPGSVRSTGFWHNMLGILSEVASADLATPLYFPAGSLRGSGRGLPEYERRANFLQPWEGGWWRLSDIVRLEEDLTWSLLRWCAERHEDLLLNFWRMNRDAVVAGREEAPYGFVVPVAQHDPGRAQRLVELLRAGGVEVGWRAGPLELEGQLYPQGAWIVDCAQAFRPFVVEMLASPDYPMVRESGGELIRPYDVTAWRLPDLLGARVVPLLQGPPPGVEAGGGPAVAAPPGGERWVPARELASYRALNRVLEQGGTAQRSGDGFLLGGAPRLVAAEIAAAGVHGHADVAGRERGPALRRARVGLYAPWGGSMDEGWTRLVLERYGFEVSQLRNEDLRAGGNGAGARLARRFDAIVLPSEGRELYELGRHPSQGGEDLGEPRWPAEYRGGLGSRPGGDRLREFAEAGGSILVLNRAADWAAEALGLPLRIGGQGLSREEFYAPGTLVRAQLERGHPLTLGMPAEVAVYFAHSPMLVPSASPLEVHAPAVFAREGIRVAGFLAGGERLHGRPAMLDIPVGEGRVVVYGFAPQRRAQTEATFPLLLNALLRAAEGG